MVVHHVIVFHCFFVCGSWWFGHLVVWFVDLFVGRVLIVAVAVLLC